MLDDLATAIIFPDRFIDKGLIPAPCPVMGVRLAGRWVYRDIIEILISAEVNRGEGLKNGCNINCGVLTLILPVTHGRRHTQKYL